MSQPHQPINTLANPASPDNAADYPPPHPSSIFVFISYGIFFLSFLGCCFLEDAVFNSKKSQNTQYLLYYLPVPILAYLTINIFLARTLTTHYWRRMRPTLWIPWILKAWLALSLIFLNLTSLIMLPSSQDEIWLIFVFGVFPIAVILAVFKLRRWRSDWMMLISTIASLIVVIAGILCLLARAPLLGLFSIVFGLAHLIPLSIGLLHLKTKGLFGTTPSVISPLCRFCGHNLTGIILTYCPKCGTDIVPK